MRKSRGAGGAAAGGLLSGAAGQQLGWLERERGSLLRRDPGGSLGCGGAKKRLSVAGAEVDFDREGL